MESSHYIPVFELSRGQELESLHYGAFAVVDSTGRLVASLGNPYTVTFLRSSSKPIQILPFIEAGGLESYDITPQELAVMCASHTGTDKHAAIVGNIQTKVGLQENQLLCGTHIPGDKPTAKALVLQGKEPTPLRHNCSGKHTGMLALAHLMGWSTEDYINPNHPVQKTIIKTFSEITTVPISDIIVSVDGCSAPVFAIPIYNAALAFARLADPMSLPEKRAHACRTATTAMMAHPDMVAGPGRFDTRLMQLSSQRIFAKTGAEGYQAIGILPDVLSPGSPGLGIALKVSDGDPHSRARPAVILELLRLLGVLNADELFQLAEFGPQTDVKNQRQLTVGHGTPSFTATQIKLNL